MSLLANWSLRRPPAAAPAPDVLLSPAAADTATGRLQYLDHFGLRSAPFQATPKTDLFCGTGGRARLLYEVLSHVRLGKGLVALCGEAGSGKTLLARMLRSCAPAAMDVALLAPPALGRADLCTLIADELSCEASGPHAVLQLQVALAQRHAAGRRMAVVIDEAERLPDLALRQIVAWTTHQSPLHLPMAVLLVGRELRDPLLDTAARLHVPRLSELDSVGYMAYRLLRAGGSPASFDGPAARRVAHAAMGLCGRINELADRSMMAAYLDGAPRVHLRHVTLALGDSALDVRRASAASVAAPASPLGRMWRRYRLGRIGPA